MSRGLPVDAIHRVQWRTRLMPLLRQQVQLLAGNHRPDGAVCHAAVGDPQGRQSAVAGQPLPGLPEGCAHDQPSLEVRRPCLDRALDVRRTCYCIVLHLEHFYNGCNCSFRRNFVVTSSATSRLISVEQANPSRRAGFY